MVNIPRLVAFRLEDKHFGVQDRNVMVIGCVEKCGRALLLFKTIVNKV
jgi:hypothetical protein